MTPDISCESCRRNLGAYLVGGLGPEGRARIARHLAGCLACSAEEARLRAAMASAAYVAPRPGAAPERRAPPDRAYSRWPQGRPNDYPGPPRPGRGPAPRGRPKRGMRPRALVATLLLLVLVGVTAYGLLRLNPLGGNAGTGGGGGILPSFGPSHQGLDALSPDLARYAAGQGKDMGVEVYDVTRDRYFEYNQDTSFLLASSAKVYIMLAYLDKVEGQGKAPSAGDKQLLTAMIEHSDNDAAQALYQRINYDAGQKGYLDKIGVPYQVNKDGWGWAQSSPAGMARALTLLQQGKILSADDRALALDLMANVEADQRMGVGDTAPDGATYVMKDGWVPGPDNLWALNSSGIVTAGKRAYVISVYTQHQDAEDWTKVDHVCAAVARALA